MKNDDKDEPVMFNRLLTQLHENEDPRERFKAAEALGETGDERAIQPLILALEDGEDVVREGYLITVSECAAIALGKFTFQGKIELFLELLEKSMPEIAVDALIRTGLSAVSALQALYEAKKENTALQINICKTLKYISMNGTLLALARVLKEVDNDTWELIVPALEYGLHRSDHVTYPPLVKENVEEIMTGVYRYGKIHRSRMITKMIALLDDNDKRSSQGLREDLVEAMGKLDNPEYLPEGRKAAVVFQELRDA